jgi:hypothetical protein
VAKFSSDRFPPGFFDLPAGAGETLPLDTIAEWTRSSQTREIARAILAPHTLRGTVVASDSAGLTRLTRDRSLIEILALLSHPKELIHGHGCAIGGRAVGIWSADNTLMFYDGSIEHDRVLAMLVTAMERMRRDCELGIGMAVHNGEFFELGGGVYGYDADRVETIAESHTEGGELIATDTFARRLREPAQFTLDPKNDLNADLGQNFRVVNGPALEGLDISNINYPAPFSDDFSTDLSRYARTRRPSAVPRQAYQELAVVLIIREREERDIPEVAVLNDLALTAAMKRIGTTLLRDLDGAEVKNSGVVGIYTFADATSAVDFARAYRGALEEQGIQCAIGIDVGPVLIFELGNGTRDIAGLAVNVASKLAEDVGAFGRIQVSDAVAKLSGMRRERPTLKFTVSGIDLRAHDL